MQLSRGNKEDGQAYIICFTDARHTVLVSTLQHLKRHYVLHFACSIWHETLKKGGKALWVVQFLPCGRVYCSLKTR